MEENHNFLSSIVTLKAKLKEARSQFDEHSKSIKMLTNETQRLDDMLSQGKRCDDKKGLGFSGSGLSEIMVQLYSFVRHVALKIVLTT